MLSPFAALVPLFLVAIAIYFLATILPRLGIFNAKGWLGELMVNQLGLKKLDPLLYQSYCDVYLPRPDDKGTTQIDHIVVSKFGIFVIETKNYKGWIFGNAKQRQWTQQIYHKKSRFQNPLHQNHLHVKALKQFLAIPEECFHSVVIFMGEAEFKTPMPENVLNRGLITWIKNRQQVLLDDRQVQGINQQLQVHIKFTDRHKVSREHVQALRARVNQKSLPPPLPAPISDSTFSNPATGIASAPPRPLP
jgi:restriction system protein